ncbi:MAG: hypothetical protein RIK87_00590 [Fuerstiella sp.]
MAEMQAGVVHVNNYLTVVQDRTHRSDQEIREAIEEKLNTETGATTDMNTHKSNDGFANNTALLVAGVLVIAACVLFLTLPDQSTGRTDEANEQSPGVTELTARRIHEVSEDQSRHQVPFSDFVQGEVLESTNSFIRLAGDVDSRVWPIAGDVEVWRHDKRATLDDLEAGNDVRLTLRQRGSKRDGWISTIVRVDIDPVAPISNPHTDVPTAVPPEADGTAVAAAGPYEVTYHGTVVDADERTVTIVDSLGDRHGFAVEPSAIVQSGQQTLEPDQLQSGDKVTLVGTRVGSRLDGWTIEIQRILVTSPVDPAES